MQSDSYVPQRIRNEIDKTTVLIIENGLLQFFNTFAKYLVKLQGRSFNNYENINENYSITFDRFKVVITMYTQLIGVSLMLFLIEVIGHTIKLRWNH